MVPRLVTLFEIGTIAIIAKFALPSLFVPCDLNGDHRMTFYCCRLYLSSYQNEVGNNGIFVLFVKTILWIYSLIALKAFYVI